MRSRSSGDPTPQPDSAEDAAGRKRRKDAADGEDLRVNDEGSERGGLRSEQPERPSTADDLTNPRTGPIGWPPPPGGLRGFTAQPVLAGPPPFDSRATRVRDADNAQQDLLPPSELPVAPQ